MKVKLLKKVRKLYAIEKCTIVPSHWSDWDKQSLSIQNLKVPFYMIRRGSDHLNSLQTYDEAYTYLANSIVTKYKEKFRGTNGQIETVWYKK